MGLALGSLCWVLGQQFLVHGTLGHTTHTHPRPGFPLFLVLPRPTVKLGHLDWTPRGWKTNAKEKPLHRWYEAAPPSMQSLLTAVLGYDKLETCHYKRLTELKPLRRSLLPHTSEKHCCAINCESPKSLPQTSNQHP